MNICILAGGPMRKISVNRKLYVFEDHPWCGPTLLKRNGEPLKKQPRDFLAAASLWAQQGRKIVDGLCEWFHEPTPLLHHIGGKHYQVIGHSQAQKGE